MNRKVLLLSSILLSIWSCGEEDIRYNQIYLNYNGNEYLYLFRQSENHLCMNSEISLCKNRYKITDTSYENDCEFGEMTCKGYLTFYYRYDSNEKFLIATKMRDYNNEIIVSSSDKTVFRYSSNYAISGTYNTTNYISTSMTNGFCDVSSIATLFDNITGGSFISVSIDYNSMSMSPDICRLAMLVQCLSDRSISAKLDSSNKSEIDLNITASCFYTMYSKDELVNEDLKTE